jgi:hypothetical protein
MAERTINATEILTDSKAGTDKTGGILEALNRLILVGLMSPSELAELRSYATTIWMPIYKCP